MKDTLHADVLRNLDQYNFKPKSSGGKYLRGGTCPSCHKKELFTHADSPWVIRCGRSNNCGYEGHVKDLFPELFNDWSTRAKEEQPTNPQAAADLYLSKGRGFDLERIKGWYTQESYWKADADGGKGAGSATVRFPLLDGHWERIIDNPARFEKRKANFSHGLDYTGRWWCPPGLNLAEVKADLWVVEGIFDAIALLHNGIDAVSILTCGNYPTHALAALRTALAERGTSVRLVWALDGDKAGVGFTLKHIARAKEEQWNCTAAQIPQRGKAKIDWNDAHQRENLKPKDVEKYLHHGALLVAANATEKALLIYNKDSDGSSFPFTYRRRTYWFKLNFDAYDKARREIEGKEELDDDQKEEARQKALQAAAMVQPIAGCAFTALYFQRNELTDESWYYFRVEFPHDAAEVRGTFTSGQITAGAEFKKRLLHLAPGALFEGTSQMLDRIIGRQTYNIRRVATVDFIGYTREHDAWLLGDVAVKGGRVAVVNEEDYFELGALSLKSLNQSVTLSINSNQRDYTSAWVAMVWECFGAKGLAALAFWLGSLFAEQIRALHKSFPFLEIVGEGGTGKTTLLEFLWKLLGRSDYEGFDPSKSSLAARARNFAQVSNLPVVLIESDREKGIGEKTHVKSFDWDELKTAYNGRSVRARGMATGGNETYEPPFRGAIVIAQNNEVSASDPVLQRICHLTFDKSRHNPERAILGKELESMAVEKVSGFILRATQAAGPIMATVQEKQPLYEQIILRRPEVKSTRIAKNHAQLLALADALKHVVTLTDAQHAALQDQIYLMAEERQSAINSDHPLVQEFWEAFDYLDAMGTVHVSGRRDESPILNHSRNEGQIAVNLNEYVEKAAAHRQQIPNLADLKKVLRTSKARRFVAVKPVNSGIRTSVKDGEEVPRTVYAWVFDCQPTTRKSDPQE